MNWLTVEAISRIAVEHLFNAIPAGFVIAFFAWALLRLLRRQNSGTRFAVWFVALLSVVAFPFLSVFGKYARGSGISHPPLTVPQSWAYFTFALWASGACAGLLRLSVGVWRMQALRRRCSPLETGCFAASVGKTISAMASASGSPIRIATSDEVRVPSAIGLWKRTIVLPAWTVRELPAADLNAILLHEFAHLRRGDDWTNLIQKIVRALFFFHPAVWWIDDRLSTEREMACDDAVLAETGNPHGYATCLVSLLEKSLAHRGWSMAQAAVNRAREASLRLAQILSKTRPTATRVWTPAVGMVGVFSVLCLATLPHAPRLIAFDGDAKTQAFSPRHSETVASVTSQGLEAAHEARIIPARMTFSPASQPVTTESHVARHLRMAVVSKSIAKTEAPFMAQRLNSEQPIPRLIAARASADQEIGPEYQTLIFIETARSMGSSGPVVMQVWSVTWIRATSEMMKQVPVANSI